MSWGKDGNFHGVITRFDPHRSRYCWLMLYEDGDEEWGAVTDDRTGWRVHGGLRAVSWLKPPPPPTDPLSQAAAAADAVPAPVPKPSAAPPRQAAAAAAPAAPTTAVIPNMMGAEIEVCVQLSCMLLCPISKVIGSLLSYLHLLHRQDMAHQSQAILVRPALAHVPVILRAPTAV